MTRYQSGAIGFVAGLVFMAIVAHAAFQQPREQAIEETLLLWAEAIKLAEMEQPFRTPEQNFIFYSCLARAKSEGQKQACGYVRVGGK